MNVIDVNVLIALFDGDHAHHRTARDWWHGEAAAGRTFTVPDIAWVGFARIVTHRRSVETPATWAEAWAFAEALIAQPTHLRFAADARTLEEFVRLASSVAARGDLVTDAYIAACAAAYGGTVVTFDRDFRKFDGLRVTELVA